MSHAMDTPVFPAWWRRPGLRLVWLAGGVLLVALLAALATRGMAERNLTVARTNVTLATVARGVFHDYVPLHGTVVPKETVYLDALAGGQVAKILVQAGDRVIAG